MADNDNRYKLWQTISKEYDLPDYNQFSKDMEDATKRKSLHDAVSAEYDLPDFDQFSKDMGYETRTSQQGNQNAQNAKKPQQTVQSSHVEEGRGLPSDNGYSKQKTAFDKAAEQAWNKLAHKGGIKWTIEGHPEVKMVAVTDDLVKRFPQLEQSRGYQVPFNMSTGTPIMQNIDDKGNIITPDEASEQYTKILTNQDFDYVPKQETAAVQIGSVVNTALSTKGGWLDRMARKSMAQYGDDWEQQKFESDGKEVSSSDVFGKVKQTIYDYYNSVLKGIRTHLMFNSDEEKQAYVDNLYKTGQLKEEDIPKANVLHYVQNVDKEEQIEAVRQAKLNRQLELKMAQERFNQLPQRGKGESDFDYNDRILHEGALYEQDIRKLKKQIAQLDAVSDELQDNNTSWKEWGHAFKTSGIGSYHAWDLGATDLKDAIELNEVANDMNGGKQMTSSDYMALRIMSQANEADAIENAVMPVSYKSKKGSFISAPFSFGFFVGGDIAKGLTSAVNKVAGKVISKAVKGAVLKAGGKKALSAATNLAEKAANTKCVKLFGMLAKDVEKAAFMENTTGAATTGAEIINRHIGTVSETNDGFKVEGESLPTAIIKGEISQNVELQTEFLGKHFPSSLKFIRGMAHTKVGSAMGLRNLAAWLTKVSRTEFATTLKSYATKAGINGVLGEYLEEVAGTAENALLVGDQKFSDLLDVKQQEEVAGSVVLSCLGMGIFGTAIYTGQRGLNMLTYYRLQHLQNKWDNAGLDLFSGEEWAKLKERIDNTPNEGMKLVMADILKADNMTEEQARAAFNYARCTLTLRGMNIGAMKAAQLGLTDDRHIEQDNAYVEGRQAKDEDKHDIQIEFEDRSHELAERLGISEQQLDNMSDEDLESLTGKDDQLDNLIYDYQTSHARYQGVVDNADDEIDKAAQEAARQTDMATDKSRGTVRNATIKVTKGEEDYGVYIVSGNVATNEDGTINVSESDDMILYYDPKSGKIEHCDAMRLTALGEEVNAEETRNQAIADAKDKAIRKQAGIIDGTVGEGTSFTITDQEGNEHTYEVLADNGDGSAMITMDGNVQDTPVSLQDLQNLKDAEEAKRLEAAKMQRQQYEEEREKQNAPVEDNLNYADIINTNGNVEIAEVVDEEGNAMFPDAEEVFFVQNQGDRAKVMVLDSEGNLQPKLVKKSSVRTLGTMSVDEYRQGRQQALKEAENASEPSLVDEAETSNNVVPTDNVVTDNTTTDETQPGNEAEVTTSDEKRNISNEQENTPKITLEDGTEVPMLEDGNPDFSQLTAGQVAELYDSQFGDDAEQIVSGNVNKAKKALDKANGMTVSGGSFAEQKASKEAKDKAIAEAKEKYDSAKAIADAYNERMLVKEEDTPEGRQKLIGKARRKFNRMKGSVKDNAQAIAQLYDETVGALLHRLYDSTGIDVFDDTANTVDEYVASSIAPYSLNYEGTETSKGVKQETGLSRSDFAKTGLLAKEGKGKTIGQLANDLWRDRPANLENITDQDVRNAIIDLITSGQTAFGLKNHIQNLRIAEAENILEQQKRQADELAHAEKQKEEELASTEQTYDNTEDSSNVEATPADAQEEDKLADMPFEAPSPDEDAPFSAKDKAKDPLEAWNNMTDEEKAAYIENNRVKNTRLVDDVVGKKLRKAIEKIAEMMGATVQWQRTDMIRNGWFNPNTKTIYLALDSSILEGVQFVFGHEMTHEIKSKSPAMYDELKKLVKEKYGEELFEAMTNDNEKRYADVGKTDNDRSYYEEETVADAIGDMINDLNLTHSIALKMSHPLLAKMHDVLLKIKNALMATPYSEDVKGIIRTIEMAYVKTANREAVNTATQEGEGGQRLSLREKPAPKKTQKVYKLMRLGEDGKLYPLFIGSGAEVELGKWYDAESPKLQDLTSLSSNNYVGTRTVTINGVDVKEKYNYGAYIVNNETGEAMSLADFKAKYSKEFAKMGNNPNKKAVNWATDNGYRWIKIEEKKQGQSRYGGEARSYYNYGINGSGGVTTFVMRPGWHAGSLPTMRQIGKGSGRNLRDDTFVWVEGEIPADIDYNEEAQKNADKDIPDHIPTDGYYLKATNANKEASQADRVGWYVAGAFKANRIMSDKEARNIIDEWNAAHPDEEKVEYDWKRESGKDFNAETMSLDGAPKFSLKVYHGSGADFTEFDFDHMGEGAGSQVFGWGGYVTSSKKIGKSYANLVDANAPHQDVEYVGNNAHEYTDVVAGLFNGGQRDYDDVKEFLQNGYNTDKENARKKQMLEWFESTKPSDWKSVNDGKRNLYEVDIPDDNGSNYLEWEKKPSNEVATKIIEGIYGLDDKTLDDMATRDIVFRTLMYDYIKNADKEQMIPILVKTNGLTRNTVYDNGNVEDDIRFVYNRLSNWMGSPKAASNFLSSLGFTGIKYPAGTIYGGAEEGDVNYVIFKPEDMQIVEHEKFSVKGGINRGYTQRENGDREKFFLRLQDAINETDTEPTEAQKKSGNYKKGHVKFGGYYYTIENPKGSYRSGVDENGKEWKQKMNDTYGYIRGKFGKDGDHLDMFINDKADLDSWNGDVFVIDQVNQDGTFDEHKVMYGYGSLDEAKKAYLSNYEKGWTGLGNITPVSKAGFDKWLDKSNRKLKPFADYADITSKTNMDTAPSSFEEFLDVVRYSIRNEKERAAAEDAYNFAQENRPDRYSRYAIVNMEKPGAVPQYLEKKAVADNWRRYYNKLKWGNYKLFNLDKPFEDNVKNLVGKFPETFRKKNDTTLSKINELNADYNKRKEEYDAMSNSIQELLNGLMKQGRSLAEAESVIRDWGLYKEMDSKYQNLMGIRKQLNELRSEKVADGERFSLIGKKGAEALDHAEEVSIRLDNLNVARQMEGAKKDAKAIKMATGWERGADGKWRYEIADSKLNDMMDVDGKGKMVKRHKEDMLWTSGKLGEVVVAPELFKAYPKLKDVRLETDSIMNNLPSNGEYNAKTNTITIHADELKYLNSILNHEIQHVIQDLEGFAQGGDSKHIRKVLERMINENQEASDYAKDKLKEWVTLTMAVDRLSDLYKQYINSDNEWLKNKAIESYWDAMNELDNNEQSTLTNDYPDGTAREIAESGYHVDEAEKELRRLAKETKESIPEGNNSALDLVSKLTDALENNDDYNLYRKLGGEVEARNVQSRMGMSPEERRKTLAEETEDVARKDQIFLYGDNDAYSLKQNKDAEYLEAVKNGDMEKAQKMVYDAARAAGYVNGTEYQGEGSWNAPSASVEKKDFANLDALRESVEEYSGDTNVYGIINGVTTNDDDFYYNPGRVGFRDAAASETSSVLRRLRYDKADANTKVKVYRTVPADVKGNNLMSGDWIALSKQYCIEHGNGRYGEGGYRIIEEEVPIKTIWNDGNDMREFGFDDGNNNEAEKNVPNNRKLLDVVTYDNNGNVIPLSERFNESNDDIRYSLRVDRYRDELNQWKKDNNLPKDAERPQLPVREPNESAADFLKRVKEYRKQAALWATAPTYEGHLLVSDTAQGQFNLEMQRKAVLTRIVIQDSMLAIRKAQEAIMKEKGVDKLNPAEDAYTAENRSHGKAKNEFEEYNDEFLQPLRKAYNELMQRLGKSYDNVKVYMIAKHGLERNAYIAFKYALDEDYETNEERMNAYNNYKADMDRLNNDADFGAGRIDFAAWKQRDGFIRTKYAPSYFKFRFDENGMTKDYSGLSALFDADDYEGAAADLVKEVEDANPYYTDELWYATNDATKKILRDSYNAGMMTEDNFNFVSGMYRNYIPLRGWGDTNADQVWNYVGGGKGAFNQVVKEAKGRKSLADDPIAYIENMAESAILMNNRNWVKQHLLLLAQNHRTSLLNVSKAWYIKTKDAQGNEEWIPASPQITDGMTGKQVEVALEAFEQKMEQMQQNGEATQKREHLEISYPQTNGEEREHEVRVMKGGEEYVIYVNGDPQLAQAVNNTRARKVREGIEESRPRRILARTGRYMAAAYTSMSPLFIPSNYMRDLTMTLASTAIREDARYNYLLRRNMLRHWNTFPMLLSYQKGTLREKVRNGSASRVEQMFYDFMMNGGETGFVTSVDVEDLKKKFRSDLKDLNRMAANPKKVGHIIMNSIETLNRAIEDSNRFVVYMTSIEYGRSIEEAVNNAKDVTLNFNRKGTGEHEWQAVRDMYLFINPAVQSLQTLGALAKHHPFKFTAVTTGWLATGLLVPMLNNLLMSFFGGDDDKDKYWQFTKWDRRNNFIMWIPFTKEFVKIPLAQEFRGFYGVGDMIASKLWGGEKAEESWGDYALDLAGQIVDMLPLDPTGYDGNIGLALTPNAARPIGELALNVDFTGKPIFKNSEYNKYDPNFTKAYVGTPDWLVRISKMVNSIDNKYPDVEQNAIDRFGDPKFNPNNPAVIDHLLSSYLGGSYTMGSQIIGVATKALNGDDIKMADIPLASKFVSNPDDRPVSKKQGEEFWDMKERHDRAANTLSKLKKKAKVDGDYSALDIFFGSDEYRQYKEDDKKVKKYEEDRKKEKAQETGEAYRPHKTTADDVYKSHTTPKDDFEDMKMKQLYEKLNSYKIRYEAIDGISSEKGDAYYKANKAAIDAIEEIAYDKSQIASIKKGFISDGQNTYDADGMKDIRELRKRILDVLEKANKVMLNNRK